MHDIEEIEEGKGSEVDIGCWRPREKVDILVPICWISGIDEKWPQNRDFWAEEVGIYRESIFMIVWESLKAEIIFFRVNNKKIIELKNYYFFIFFLFCIDKKKSGFAHIYKL